MDYWSGRDIRILRFTKTRDLVSVKYTTTNSACCAHSVARCRLVVTLKPPDGTFRPCTARYIMVTNIGSQEWSKLNSPTIRDCLVNGWLFVCISGCLFVWLGGDLIGWSLAWFVWFENLVFVIAWLVVWLVWLSGQLLADLPVYIWLVG